ncbi:MAG: DUF481 domain-containing protein [Alteraurantiacibacter sp.]
MNRIALAAMPCLLLSTPAAAQEALPDAAQAMIDAAIASGDKDDVEAVIAAARAAFPASSEQLDAVDAAYRTRQAEEASQAAAQRETKIRQASLFENWSGEGQVGGFVSTGNSDEIGATAALQLERKGIDWEHRLRFAADYRKDDGLPTRERFLAQYEPRYQVSESLFGFGLAQYERDTRQGLAARYVVSGGFGYHLIDSETMELSIKAGPAYRVTEFLDGRRADRLAALAGLDFDWQLSEAVKLTQDANSTVETGGEALLVIDSSNTSLSAITGIEAGLADSLTARLSYTVEYDSNPPPGKLATDTLTRFTLIYGF